MLLRDITITNIKCFTNAHVDFTHGRDDQRPHKWIVVYGDNGLGKSTLLKSLAVSIAGQPALNVLVPTAEGWVRGAQRFGSVAVSALKGGADVSWGYPRARPIKVRWNFVGRRATTIDKKPYSAHQVFLDDGHTKSEQDDAKILRSYVATDEPARGWLMCGYGPHRRLTGNASEIADSVTPDSRASRLVTLFHEKAALSSAERWLREMHHRASVEKDRAQKRLDAVIEIIAHGLLPEGVELSDITPEGVFFKTPFSPSIPIADLSDGYRTVLAVALDLLRHISYCFEMDTVLERTDARLSVNAEGVVLIDEIDSHLHPKWQRTIALWLHDRFPNIQFIVATHSPLIPTRVSLDDGMIVRLERRRSGKTEHVELVPELGRLGLTADQRLTGPDFGLTSTRDVLVDRLIDEMTRLRNKVRRRTADARERAELKQLQLKFDRVAPVGATFMEAQEWEERAKSVESATREVPVREPQA